MRIGVDLDNTLINYDGVFYRTAMKLNWLNESVGSSKSEVKHYLQTRLGADSWTELQGIVYGETIQHAVPYDGSGQALRYWQQQGHQLYLVSHKTKYPVIGEKRDFHLAANNWLKDRNFYPLFTERFFCATKDAKVKQIASLELDIFIDDLSSVLQHQDFPARVYKILFGSVSDTPELVSASDWSIVTAIVDNYASR